MPVVVLVVALAGLGGTLVSYTYDRDSRLTTRLAFGVLTSMVAMAVAALLAAHVAGLVFSMRSRVTKSLSP